MGYLFACRRLPVTAQTVIKLFLFYDLGDRAYGAEKIHLYLSPIHDPPTKNLLQPWKYDWQTYERRNV